MQNGVSKWRRIKWQYETPDRSMAPTRILRQQRKERRDKETIDPNSKMAAGALIESSYCGLLGWSSWWNGSCKDQPGAEMQSRWNKENPEGLICRLVNFWLLLKPPPQLSISKLIGFHVESCSPILLLTVPHSIDFFSRSWGICRYGFHKDSSHSPSTDFF